MTEHNGGESGFGSDAVPTDSRTPENGTAGTGRGGSTAAASTPERSGSGQPNEGQPDAGDNQISDNHVSNSHGSDSGSEWTNTERISDGPVPAEGINPTLPMHEWWNRRHDAGESSASTAQEPTAARHGSSDDAPVPVVSPEQTSSDQTSPMQTAPEHVSPHAAQSGAHSGFGQPGGTQPQYGQYAQTSFGTPAPPPDYPAGSPSFSHSGSSLGNSAQDNAGHGHPVFGQTHPHAGGPGYPAGQRPGKRREKKRVGAGIFVAGMVAAALVGGGTGAGASLLLGNPTSAVSSSQAAPNIPLIVNNTNDVSAVTAAAQKATPSVVTISAASGNSGGTGSGVILDTAGHILTNTHVVTLDGAAANATLEVRTSDGKVYPAKVVGTDPLSDLAVIKINAPGLVPATLGDSDKINVGDTVIAIGAPLGLSGTVTDGIVSTLNRTIQVASSAVPKSQSDSSGSGNGNGFNFAPPDGSSGSNSATTGTVNLNVIQTDAAINPGNSGGALTNTKGEIIGVNVAIASAGSSSSSSSQSGNIGVGFSIPIDTAKRISQEIIANGKATHGQLGVSVKPSAAGSQANSGSFSNGAVVASVVSGSAGNKAGFKAGDVITNFGTRVIDDASALTAAVREQAAGATVKATFLRDGKQQSVDVTLDAASE
ncbi:trypsin-like peptidase domain-containing protein [Arthrobacter sp. A5]|uniref:S1C family serine protease n=1 Tax=Arthrobacter sp. A5 TaxID=576926 RepID=UPI003DA9E613